MKIHPSAVVDPAAKIPESCTIGPFCYVGAEVELGEECELISHVVLQGPSRIGARNRIFPFASVGMGPQDLSYKGEPTRLEIGDDNQVREFATIHRGTVKGGGVTSDRQSHADHGLCPHRARLPHRRLGHHGQRRHPGRTRDGRRLRRGRGPVPGASIRQIGKHAYIGGGTTITQDVLPFSKTSAVRDVHAYGANSVGLQRRGFRPSAYARSSALFACCWLPG